MHHVVVAAAVKAGMKLWIRIQATPGEELQTAGRNLTKALDGARKALLRRRAGEEVDLMGAANELVAVMTHIARLLAEAPVTAGPAGGPTAPGEWVPVSAEPVAFGPQR